MWECQVCKGQMEDDVSVCKGCGAKKGAPAKTAPAATHSATEVKVPEIRVQTEPEEPRIGVAIIFGGLSAVVCSVLWYGAVVLTGYQLGILAVAIGFLVAHAVVYGAKGQRGVPYQVISVVFILLSMGLSDYLIIRHFFVKELAGAGAEVPLFLGLDVMVDLVVLYIKEDPLTLLFWGFAVFEGIKIPSKAALAKAQAAAAAEEEAKKEPFSDSKLED